MYKDDILNLIKQSPLEIDTEIQMTGKPPTMANSEFLTNKEQGDWAETIVFKAVNEYSGDYFAVKYGRSESIAAGDDGFADFYMEYQSELNAIGKRPDILIFKVRDFPDGSIDIKNDQHIRQAVAAIEVRSSSFLADKYAAFMRDRWSSTKELRNLTELLKNLKENIKILHKRDYLGITPKIEDVALVNRWIQKYNVKHFYLQVFFDKAYIISFKDILALVSNDNNDGNNFSIERDVKNQGKTTIKINVQIGKEVIGKIDMPEHKSALKELDRGRLLFYVTFAGGKGYLDNKIFLRDVINA